MRIEIMLLGGRSVGRAGKEICCSTVKNMLNFEPNRDCMMRSEANSNTLCVNVENTVI